MARLWLLEMLDYMVNICQLKVISACLVVMSKHAPVRPWEPDSNLQHRVQMCFPINIINQSMYHVYITFNIFYICSIWLQTFFFFSKYTALAKKRITAPPEPWASIHLCWLLGITSSPVGFTHVKQVKLQCWYFHFRFHNNSYLFHLVSMIYCSHFDNTNNILW